MAHCAIGALVMSLVAFVVGVSACVNWVSPPSLRREERAKAIKKLEKAIAKKQAELDEWKSEGPSAS